MSFGEVTPLVSVFVPTYNHSPFIRECLESCLAQDYSNIEIVVGDDCSSDGTDKVVRELQACYPDKIVFSRFDANMGVTANANQVLRLCHGEFIAFTSGDDVLFPNKVSRQVAFMRANPDVVICYHDVECYEQEAGKVTYNYSDRFPMIPGSLWHLMRNKTFFATNSAMMRTRSVPLKGFDTRLSYSSDWLFFMEALMQEGDPKNGIAFVPEVLGRYRRHGGNVTQWAGEYGLRETLVTLDIAVERAPAYRVLAHRVKAERLFTQSTKDLLKGHVVTALCHAAHGTATSPLGLVLFASNLARYVRSRIVAYFNRVRN